MAVELTIEHRGRRTQATARGGEAQIKKLRNALLLGGFRILGERKNRLELRRRAYLSQDDWPVQVSIRREGTRLEVEYYLYIPWGWIIAFTVLMVLVLPFAGVPNALLAFALALTMAALAVYKQKFDCRPNARFWQQRPRQRWGEVMEKLLREVLGDA